VRPAHLSHRAATTITAVAVAVAAVAGLVQARNATGHAQAQARADAQQQLSNELRMVRAAFATPAHAGSDATAALRILAAGAILGSERDTADLAADLDRRLATLRDAADALEDASVHPIPDRPSALRVAVVDEVFGQLEPLDDQAARTATHLRDAADHTARVTAASLDLARAASDYAAGSDELPDSDDPEQIASAWRDELDRLADYDAAVSTAETVAAAAPLAQAHRELVDHLIGLANAAIDDLEGDDVDAYNERLTDELGRDSLDALTTEVADASQAVLDPTLRELELAQDHVLGLLDQLERIRRATPATIATS
jgi:hypothetical protein